MRCSKDGCGKPLPGTARMMRIGISLHREHPYAACGQLLQWHERYAGIVRESLRSGGPPVECPVDCPDHREGSLCPIA